ncbi:MAG: CopG family transcriptional regulator [Flavobacteriales bacterium]|jgi:ribosomal protein L10|nr:CopG family transcriptional regulator [Flavobacteriales bacterium]
MATFTTTLPNDLLDLLSQKAAEYHIAKNKLIEKALRVYLDELKKAEYIKSYKRAAKDPDTLLIAEEGMADYFRQLNELDNE